MGLQVSLKKIPLHVCFGLLVSVVTPGRRLTSEELNLGSADEREYAASVFLGLGYLPQCDLI